MSQPPAKAEPDLTLEEFRRAWLHPVQVVEIFEEHGVRLGKQTLLNRLTLGLLLAGAEHVSIAKRDGTTSGGFGAVPPWVWAKADLKTDSDFWETGDLARVLAEEEAEMQDPRASNLDLNAAAAEGLRIAAVRLRMLDYVGVRFDPADIRAMLPTNKVFFVAPIEPEGSEEASAHLKPVAPDKLESFADLYARSLGDASVLEKGWKAARAFFHENHVTRSRFRDALGRFRGSVGVGRKRSAENDGR